MIFVLIFLTINLVHSSPSTVYMNYQIFTKNCAKKNGTKFLVSLSNTPLETDSYTNYFDCANVSECVQYVWKEDELKKVTITTFESGCDDLVGKSGNSVVIDVGQCFEEQYMGFGEEFSGMISEVVFGSPSFVLENERDLFVVDSFTSNDCVEENLFDKTMVSTHATLKMGVLESVFFTTTLNVKCNDSIILSTSVCGKNDTSLLYRIDEFHHNQSCSTFDESTGYLEGKKKFRLNCVGREMLERIEKRIVLGDQINWQTRSPNFAVNYFLGYGCHESERYYSKSFKNGEVCYNNELFPLFPFFGEESPLVKYPVNRNFVNSYKPDFVHYFDVDLGMYMIEFYEDYNQCSESNNIPPVSVYRAFENIHNVPDCETSTIIVEGNDVSYYFSSDLIQGSLNTEDTIIILVGENRKCSQLTPTDIQNIIYSNSLSPYHNYSVNVFTLAEANRFLCLSGKYLSFYPDNISSIKPYCGYTPNYLPTFMHYPVDQDCNGSRYERLEEGSTCLPVVDPVLVSAGYQSAIYTCYSHFCDGISSRNKEVCSGRGECWVHDNCLCNKFLSFQPYGGKYCQKNYIPHLIALLSFLLLCCAFCVYCGISSCTCLFCSCCCCVFCYIPQKKRFSKQRKLDEEKERLLTNKLDEINYNVFGETKLEMQDADVKKDDGLVFEGDPNGMGKQFIKEKEEGKKKKKKKTTNIMVFEGEFLDGLRHGKGVEYFVNLPKRKKSGKGNTAHEDNDEMRRYPCIKFEGQYQKGRRSGKGVEYSVLNEKTLRGVWENGCIVEIERDFVDLPKIKVSDFQFDFMKDRIGKGAEGDVFRVTYEGQEAALKVFRGDGEGQFWYRDLKKLREKRMFLRSQKIWSKVNGHPYILELYSWTGTDSEPRGYVTELCRFSLSEAIRNDYFKGDWKSKIRIMYEVAVGMQYLHNLSIMHRDLKAGNVLVDKSENAKICDFEFSRYDDLDWKKEVEIQSFIGTPVSLAPEIMQGKVYTKSCDVFSFGILLYCVYFGKINPYRGISSCPGCGVSLLNPQEPLMTHVDKCNLRPVFEKAKIVECPWVVNEITVPCLNKDPRRRPSFDDIVRVFKKNMSVVVQEKGDGIENEEEDQEEINYIE